MKIALCLSGEARHSMFCFPYLWESFIDNGYDVDVYIHSWREFRALPLYSAKKVLIENENVIEEIKSNIHIPPATQIDGVIDNNIKMFYSFKKAFQLLNGKYDIVIRSRFDVFFNKKLDLKKIIDELVIGEYDIYIPNEEYNYSQIGYNDQMAIGTYPAMKIYSETLDNINQIVEKTLRWYPEDFLGIHLKNNSIRIKQTNIDYRLVRYVTPRLNYENPKVNLE
jgi:hypothetical protein